MPLETLTDNVQDADNEQFPKEPQAGKKRLSVERIYQKKSQLEHILLRPDTYIGSVETLTQTMWVYDGEEAGMVNREVTFVPGLYKIFDEILVNAADNKQRDKSMDCIKIDIDAENNRISVWNNGKGIPVVEHKTEKMFVPSLIFGQLLTSSNYNDEEKKVTGGRNGYGAKLCNIFSTKFTVETACKEYKKSFKQSWQDNMKKTTEPKVTSSSEDYTRITFFPDLAKFKMDTLDKDIVALMSRRAFDVAASTRGVKVYLNGKRLPIKGFKDYVEMFTKGKEDEEGNPLKIVYESVSDRWEIAITMSDHGFQQMSFVNSIATTKGGRHVDYVTDQIVSKLVEAVKKKNKAGINIKPFQVKNHLWVFVNCLIVNPTFDSQTKENMTLQAKSFGSKCSLSDKFYAQVLKCGVLESILTWVRFKAQSQLNQKCASKKHTKLKGIPKLEDANDAGTKNSIDCTLILTEGDSAKSLAVSGLGVVGRDKYGVFPLKGKMLNVREASHKQILENAEINNVIKIMGLQYKKKYESIEDLKTLRYGRLMIMTDQDQDGSHIKGLLINFIHHNWPSLLKLPFLEEFITPIVKATKGREERSFYSLPEFEEWKSETTNWPTWKIKYYKGLGTSTAKEAKEYFADMLRHRIKFKYDGAEDDRSIELAFSKKCIDLRKDWLTSGLEERKQRREMGLPELYLYGKDTKAVTYTDFVNKELILFSNMDNERSIPSLVDGLKPGQRKVIYTCLKRNDKREIKVAQLAGSVAEHSAYHHGEASLMSTIINLAQNFVGSNNINLLQPIGQFGTRLQGGKDAASPRYIFTMLSSLARHIFPKTDEPLLNNLRDDNQKIEPEYYVPIIPMVLVNGAEGIGTGWSTKVPNYNPREIVANVKRMIHGDDPLPMTPWFKNFKGSIEQLDPQRFIVSGELSIIDSGKLEITELPIRTWTQAYKENVLELMLHGTDKIPSLITDYKEYHTDTTVRFLIVMTDDKLSTAEQQGLHKVFKLQSSVSLSSMVLFDKNGCIKRYDCAEEILREFFTVRLDFYVRRKAYMIGMLTAEAKKLGNQARFILEKCENKIVIENKRKVVMIQTLVDRGYDSDPVEEWKKEQARRQGRDPEEEEAQADTEDESKTEETDTNGPNYDYLLGMTLWTLTKEKKDELLKKRDAKNAELEELRQKSPENLWEDDLDKFLEELDRVEEKEREDEKSGSAGKPVKGGKGGGKKRTLKAETMPTPTGQRVVPRIDSELKKRFEKPPPGAKKRMKKGDGTAAAVASVEGAENQPEDSDKVKVKRSRAPKGEGKKAKKGAKRNSWSSSESEVSDASDVEMPSEPRAKSMPKRAAAAKIKFEFGSDEEKNGSDDEENFKPNFGVSEEGGNGVEIGSDRDVEDFGQPDKAPSHKLSASPQSSDEMFDSMGAQGRNSGSEPEPLVPKPAAKKLVQKTLKVFTEKPAKKPAPKKKKVKEDSDSSADEFKSEAPKKVNKAPAAGVRRKKVALIESDSEDSIKSKPKTKKPKKKALSDDSFSEMENVPIEPKARSGRSKAAVQYNFGSDSSDEDF